MIKYLLKCAEDHEFQAWFANSSAYEKLARSGQIHCPTCGGQKVEKALMAPSIVSGAQRETIAKPAQTDTRQHEALQLMRKLKTFVERNSEYVGPRFAEEALKIHHEEAEARSIYGEASKGEVDDLREEGVEFYSLPTVPEDHN